MEEKKEIAKDKNKYRSKNRVKKYNKIILEFNEKIEDLEKIGYNNSMVHSDFMFGSEDMEITGVTQDGKEVRVFEKGNFII